MIKRTLVITLTDGKEITQDLSDFVKAMQTNPQLPPHERMPLNPPATHDAFKGLCASVFMSGVELLNTSSKDYLQVVAPSQIKTVEVIFTDH